MRKYPDLVKRHTTVASVTHSDALLERIKHLGEQVTHSPVNSRQHRMMKVAIRIHADAYRKSLDTEQALARRARRIHASKTNA